MVCIKDKKWLAAVSGGPDSMCMLDMYKKYIKCVCHVNYHKRIDSNIDEKIVREYCKKNKIKLEICNVNKEIYKKKIGNFQNFARLVRYNFFIECSHKYKCNNLLVAHHLNDFLETAIMQQNRKSKNFFYGIKDVNTYKNLYIYRPLINFFKKDLISYCKKKNISYVIDSSNSSSIYERNRIRKKLDNMSNIQLLKIKHKYLLKNKISKSNEIILNKLFNQWAKKEFSLSYFKSIHLPKTKMDSLFYIFLKNINVTKINSNKIKMLREFILANNNKKTIRLQSNIFLSKKSDRLIWNK